MEPVRNFFSSMMFNWILFEKFFPLTLSRSIIKRHMKPVYKLFNPYVSISFHEKLPGDTHLQKRNEAFDAIHNYLTAKSIIDQAEKLRGESFNKGKSVLFTLDENEEVHDYHGGIRVSWCLLCQGKENLSSKSKIKKYYKLTFRKCYREQIMSSYVNYVLERGRELEARKRQRRLYTNKPGSSYRHDECEWSNVTFEHPATFETVGMDPVKKKELIDELVTFTKSKEYYERIGRAWKRGYLLYGPPGTGKTTLVAAISNLLGYDVYDLELTAVADNNDLRKLVNATTAKSILLIEDIDCSLDVTGKRKRDEHDGQASEKKIKIGINGEKKESQVTLSGLLNSLDGLWSSGNGEKLIIFTSNYIDKLDPALIRSGRMDKHIELSYCDYESFKVLARNYLGISSHPLFGKIKSLLEEIQMSPADVAEHLMPKTLKGPFTETTSLKTLIQALEASAHKKLQESNIRKAEEKIVAISD